MPSDRRWWPAAQRAARDGPGPWERRDSRGTVLVGVVSEEVRQRDLRQARPGQRAARAPARRRGADLPQRRGPAVGRLALVRSLPCDAPDQLLERVRARITRV